MKAIQVQVPGGPENLLTVELPDPVPGPGQVRVAAHAIGVGRSDVLIRKGTYKWMPPMPAIPGSEMAGVVDAIGPGVDNWQLGDRVLVSARELEQRGGCYAQHIVVPANAPFRLPHGVAFEAAVSLPNLQLALALMRVAPPAKPAGGHALITGASGGVAGMLCQVAKRQGYVTTGTSRSASKAQAALAQGFDHVITLDQGAFHTSVQRVTEGVGLDLVFDHLGGPGMTEALHALAPLGTLVSYNIVQGMPTEDVFQTLRALLAKSLAVRCFSMHTFDESRNTRRALMQEAIGLVAQGLVTCPPVQVFRLQDAVHTHVLLDQGQVTGKLVLQP